jgi:hypothetical protein
VSAGASETNETKRPNELQPANADNCQLCQLTTHNNSPGISVLLKSFPFPVAGFASTTRCCVFRPPDIRLSKLSLAHFSRVARRVHTRWRAPHAGRSGPARTGGLGTRWVTPIRLDRHRAVIVRGTAMKDPPLTDASECEVRSRHASTWNDLAIGPKIAKLASRHSERDEGHHFSHGFFGPMYEPPTICSERGLADTSAFTRTNRDAIPEPELRSVNFQFARDSGAIGRSTSTIWRRYV